MWFHARSGKQASPDVGWKWVGQPVDFRLGELQSFSPPRLRSDSNRSNRCSTSLQISFCACGLEPRDHLRSLEMCDKSLAGLRLARVQRSILVGGGGGWRKPHLGIGDEPFEVTQDVCTHVENLSYNYRSAWLKYGNIVWSSNLLNVNKENFPFSSWALWKLAIRFA